MGAIFVETTADRGIFAAMLTIGLLREGKVPRDSRVALTPAQVAALAAAHPEITFLVQPADFRCYADQEYRDAGIQVQEDVSACDVLLGVKEVPVGQLIGGKTYFIFSHTIKKQPHNRELLRAVLDKKVRLIDWETLTDEQGRRVIAFGRWAGIVGGHNALWTWGVRSDAYRLPRAYECKDFEALKQTYAGIKLPAFKILLAGGGRVAQGTEEVLQAAGVLKISPEQFLATGKPEQAVYTSLDCPDFYRRKDDQPFDWQHFFKHPAEYESAFAPYRKATDLFINAIYWDPAAPRFFDKADMLKPDFRIRVIADITCDINGSVPSTVKSTTIAEPLFGTDLVTGGMTGQLFGGQILTTMSIDNLPNELPRDASQAFGAQFSEQVWPELLKPEDSRMLAKACLARDGELNEPFLYLADYVGGHTQKH